ncbi:MAG: hypothetical protein RLZZ546_713 [Bacteroidota bacterium]|jgi:rSAM/selenodomain-associated transferase 1
MVKKNNALIVFVKNTDTDHVKTRIAATEGAIKAKEIYTELVNHCKSLCSSLTDIDVIIYFSHHTEDESWPFIKKIQSGDDLGSKMSHAFEITLNDYHKVVTIGSDCPYLKKELIIEAFENLNKVDIVIGPAFDGGYYLIGLKKEFPEIFQGIEWSTNRVFNQTIDVAFFHSKSISTLEYLEDIDIIEDYLKWKRSTLISI